MQPRIIIVAGPNGAGKTTFAREFLPHEAGCPVFLNADLIAAGLSPFDPALAAIQAGRLMLQAIAQRVGRLESFAFESTLSGLAYARQIPQWRSKGYRVDIFFLSLPSADLAVQRVASRVIQGGHDIPEATVRRRFEAGIHMFRTVYQPLVDQWVIYDNAGVQPVLIDWSANPSTAPGRTREPKAAYGDWPADADPFLRGSMEALRRAGQRARELARQTGTDVIVMRDGRIVRVSPRDKKDHRPA
jgi:predicted ABC-type ATPase